MKRFFTSTLILFLSLVAGYYTLSIWRGVSLLQTSLSRESFLKASQATPSNPNPFYRLGLFYHWDIRNIDLKKSLHYFRKVIERNPLEQGYWLNLARILQRMGESKPIERALENTILLFPAGYQGRRETGNLLLRGGGSGHRGARQSA